MELYSPPDESCLTHGAKYVCTIDRDARRQSGKIFDEHGDLCWQYRVRKNPVDWTLKNPFNKLEFVFADADARDEFVIRRTSFIPSRFEILFAKNSIGRIELRNVLGIKYVINIDGYSPWTFRMPLFTIRFWGSTKNEPSIWVLVGPSKMQWTILLKPETRGRELVVALAFIHSQWWTYG